MLLSRAGVPEQYRDAAWARCRARDVLEPWALALRNHAAAGKGLILTGPVGTGKSSTAGIIARRAIEIGLSVRWEYVKSLLDDLDDRTERKSAFGRQARTDLLILDDFAVAKIEHWQIPHIDRIVEHRYSRRLPTIVTANVPISTMAADPALARFVDRWRERMTGVELVGDSMRRKPSE